MYLPGKKQPHLLRVKGLENSRNIDQGPGHWWTHPASSLPSRFLVQCDKPTLSCHWSWWLSLGHTVESRRELSKSRSQAAARSRKAEGEIPWGVPIWAKLVNQSFHESPGNLVKDTDLTQLPWEGPGHLHFSPAPRWCSCGCSRGHNLSSEVWSLWPSSFQQASESPGGPVKMQRARPTPELPIWQVWGGGQRICISIEPPSDPDAAGPRTRGGEPWRGRRHDHAWAGHVITSSASPDPKWGWQDHSALSQRASWGPPRVS